MPVGDAGRDVVEYTEPVKRVAKWTTFDEATSDQIREALSRTPAERLAMIQRIREAHWGLFGGAPTGMERVSTFAETSWRSVRHGRGLTVGVHGHERYTKDLDLLVDPSEATLAGLVRAIYERSPRGANFGGFTGLRRSGIADGCVQS